MNWIIICIYITKISLLQILQYIKRLLRIMAGYQIQFLFIYFRERGPVQSIQLTFLQAVHKTLYSTWF